MKLSWIARKKKSTYDIIVKADEAFQNVIFAALLRILNKEQIPSSFDFTTLVQIYKGKGLREELANSHFIHSKQWLPRMAEAMVVDKFKEKLIDSMTKYQIGGKPGHRPSEHLFVVKSVIAHFKMMDRPLLLQVYDLCKFFDKENLRDAMGALHKAGVDQKFYRLWFLLNCKTKIQVRTSVGLTEMADVGEVLGQGSRLSLIHI